MEYVLKIYSNQNSSSPFNAVENLNNIAFNRDLNNFSIMELDLPINISGLSQFNKVELCIAGDGADTVEFGGYIHNIKPTNGRISLECRNYKALLLKKIILSDKNFSGTTISSAFASIFSEWKIATNEDWLITSSFTGTFTKKFSEGDNRFDILDEIGELTECVRNVEGNTIIFEQILGEDRSVISSPSFFELVYNGEDLNENNIDTIETETYSTQSNLIIGKGANGSSKSTAKDATSIASIGCFAEYKSFREGDLTTQVNQYLAMKKQEQKSFKIKGRKNVGDELNIGDKIHLRVEKINEYMNIETDVFVLEKQVSIENGTKIINLTLSQIYATMDSFTRKIDRIQKNINLLSL